MIHELKTYPKYFQETIEGNKPFEIRKDDRDFHVGDVLKMKKAHPCGSQEWLVLRVGMDFRMRCLGCGHEVMLPRNKAEKSVRKVYRDGTEVKLEARLAKGGQGGGEEA